MATHLKNLSDYDPNTVPSAEGMRFGIAVAEWNHHITGALLDGAVNSLIKHGTSEKHIIVKYVPGTFELTYAAAKMVESNLFDAVIVLGCVIQGDTRHFDFICNGVTKGITTLNEQAEIPVIFGVLTTDNEQQALDRAGGKHGNKGDEAAITAIKMVDFSDEFIDELNLDDEEIA
ncbi:MAG: 6,7-dimethyl-8-ribityllumazine synthase [Bacteroidales bacterium]|nr:6,7-dimethyl-8-ribityllumazine synthase [Bacteroidales bacterium]